ncbi:MAG TPA: sigma-70 family RNA polymerase sigma factor [Ferruginibacter sp.]|nr:sigma-70 family RNA polymerase sigma factor [Ferruginibacter sp.]HMP20515.1 sigma-70 family RNA polymerase sigma factor [Ferruginibacter sp.]
MHKARPEQWVKNYADMLFAVALQKTNSREVAEDLVQDTFLSAIKALENYRGEASEKNWLFTILNNKVIDYYRKKGRRQTTETYLADTEAAFDDSLYNNGHITGSTWRAGWSSEADANINDKDFQQVLSNCLDKVPVKMKPVFISKYFHDLPPDEICAMFEISNANLWVIMHRVKVILKNCLTHNWFSNT